jgi:hypothetical protein
MLVLANSGWKQADAGCRLWRAGRRWGSGVRAVGQETPLRSCRQWRCVGQEWGEVGARWRGWPGGRLEAEEERAEVPAFPGRYPAQEDWAEWHAIPSRVDVNGCKF